MSTTSFSRAQTTKQSKQTIFPVGGLLKSEVKQIAAELKLNSVLARKESMGICFVGKRRNFSDFLKDYVADSKPGHFVDLQGNVVGHHKGFYAYTIGQRASLSIGTTARYVF